MRKLQTSDVFAAMRLIRKAKRKEEIKPYLKMAAEGSFDVEDIGIEGILGVVEIFAAESMEMEIYKVLSGPLEMAAADIAIMEPALFIKSLQELAEVNDIKGFFTLLVGLISKS